MARRWFQGGKRVRFSFPLCVEYEALRIPVCIRNHAKTPKARHRTKHPCGDFDEVVAFAEAVPEALSQKCRNNAFGKNDTSSFRS
eukprot:3489490-Amphidinium_carterae.1